MNYQDKIHFLIDEAQSKGVNKLIRLDVGNVQNEHLLAKRIIDIGLAIPLIVLLAPVMLGIFLTINIFYGGQAIFRQKRIGQFGEEFYCLKFRTMVLNAPQKLQRVLENNPEAAAEWERDQKLKNDPRITAFGKFLRKTSLDELPQLWNILKGEMSLVGPRPIVKNEVQKYGRYFRAYSSVPPGITGLWQISGRNNTTYQERVRLDAEYAKTHTVFLDLKILFQTVPAVLFSKGAY